MNYLISVWGDRIQAEEAYTALEKGDMQMSNVSILGKGFKSADEYGLVDPADEAWKQVKRLAFWTVPFGFISGFAFNSITGLNTFPWAGTLGNQIIGGILGGGAGAMGGFFIGGGAGVGFSGSASYRNRLSAGKYLVVVKGSEAFISQASRTLRPMKPEDIEGYSDPGTF